MPPMPQIRSKNSFHQRQGLIEYYQTCLQIHHLQSEEVEMEKPDNSKWKKKKIHFNLNDDEEKKDE